MLTDDLIAAQRDREDTSIEKGVERFQNQQLRKVEKDGLEATDSVSKMLRGATPLVAEGLRKWLDARRAEKGRKPVAFKPIELIDIDKLALIGTSAVFHELANGGAVAAITHQIGRLAQVELEADAMLTKDKKRAKSLKGLVEKGASTRTLEERHADLAADLGVDLGWTGHTRVLVGQAVLGVILIDLKEVFVQTRIHTKGPKGAHTIPAIELTPEAVTVLLEMEDIAAFMRPLYTPMIAPPRPWTSMNTGAYLDLRVSKTVPLVKTFSGEHRRLIREALKAGEMQEVLDAVNAIQGTRFAIDKDILRLIRWAVSDNTPTIDPSAEYSAETYAAMQAALATKQDRDAKVVLQRRKAYQDALSAMVAKGHFAALSDDIQAMKVSVEPDDNLAMHVTLLENAMARISAGLLAPVAV